MLYRMHYLPLFYILEIITCILKVDGLMQDGYMQDWAFLRPTNQQRPTTNLFVGTKKNQVWQSFWEGDKKPWIENWSKEKNDGVT